MKKRYRRGADRRQDIGHKFGWDLARFSWEPCDHAEDDVIE